MGNVHNKSEQRWSRRRFTIESNIKPPSKKEPFLITTEPKCKAVKMYHINGIVETVGKTKKM